MIPYHDGKKPGAISTSLIEPDRQRCFGQALSNRNGVRNDVEQALLRRKEAWSDKYRTYRTGPLERIRTSLVNRKGARNDKEQALS